MNRGSFFSRLYLHDLNLMDYDGDIYIPNRRIEEGQRRRAKDTYQLPLKEIHWKLPHNTMFYIPIGQNLSTWSHLGAREGGKCSLYLGNYKKLFYYVRMGE